MSKGKKKPKPNVLLGEAALQLTEAEKDSVYSAAVRVPQVLNLLLDHLTAADIGADEVKYQLLFTACRRVRKDGGEPSKPGYRKRLKAAVRDLAKSESLVDPDDSVVGELADPDGFIDQAFAADPDDLDLPHTLGLLKRYVGHLRVVHPLHAALATAVGDGCTPADVRAMLAQVADRLRAVEAIGGQAVPSVGERWEEHQTRLKRYRGQKMIGLRTGLAVLDRNTLGVRGLSVIAARPGAGKTTLVLQICIGVCRYHVENDAVVVVVSLDMSAHDLLDRLHCNLAGIEWPVLKFGSPEAERVPGSLFSVAAKEQLKKAEKLLDDFQVRDRLVVLDRIDLGDQITAERLADAVRAAKERVGAKRALLVIDYLQLIPVPEDEAGNDLVADKARVRLVQRVVEGSRTADDPAGDAVLVISEARKPPSAKEEWGSSLSELMGSARLAYAADAVLLYQQMSKPQMAEWYGLAGEEDAEARRAVLEKKGVVPLVLDLTKGRDGMRRGHWGVEFDYRRSVFTELDPLAKAATTLPPDALAPAAKVTYKTLKKGKGKAAKKGVAK